MIGAQAYSASLWIISLFGALFVFIAIKNFLSPEEYKETIADIEVRQVKSTSSFARLRPNDNLRDRFAMFLLEKLKLQKPLEEMWLLLGSPTKPQPVDKPQDCPRGYLKAIAVTPTRYSQYVTGADLNVNLTGETNTGTATSGHKHSVTITGRVNNPTTSVNGTAGNLVVNGQSGGAQNTTLTLRQLPPVQVTIDGTNDTQWSVGFSYGNVNVSGDHPVTAIAQTYCVFDEANFSSNAAVNENSNGVAREKGKNQGGIIQDGQRRCSGTVDENDCLDGEICLNGWCVLLDKCNNPDGTPLGGRIYCQDKKKVYWECMANSDCGAGKTCDSSHNCVSD